MTLKDYVSLFIQYNDLNLSLVFPALAYINRLSKTQIPITKYNMHKIVAVSLMLATKYYEDFYYSNKRWY